MERRTRGEDRPENRDVFYKLVDGREYVLVQVNGILEYRLDLVRAIIIGKSLVRTKLVEQVKHARRSSLIRRKRVGGLLMELGSVLATIIRLSCIAL